MDHNFKDFHFKAEVQCFENSNSGIYFDTKYQGKGFPQVGFEAQVNNMPFDLQASPGEVTSVTIDLATVERLRQRGG